VVRGGCEGVQEYTAAGGGCGEVAGRGGGGDAGRWGRGGRRGRCGQRGRWGEVRRREVRSRGSTRSRPEGPEGSTTAAQPRRQPIARRVVHKDWRSRMRATLRRAAQPCALRCRHQPMSSDCWKRRAAPPMPHVPACTRQRQATKTAPTRRTRKQADCAWGCGTTARTAGTAGPGALLTCTERGELRMTRSAVTTGTVRYCTVLYGTVRYWRVLYGDICEPKPVGITSNPLCDGR
jgi:hypothetical protein